MSHKSACTEVEIGDKHLSVSVPIDYYVQEVILDEQRGFVEVFFQDVFEITSLPKHQEEGLTFYIKDYLVWCYVGT